MQHLKLIAMIFLFLQGCHVPVETSQFSNESWELSSTSSTCEIEIKSSGLSGRLGFCKLSNPSSTTVTSCINNTFNKISTLSAPCKGFAGRLFVEVNSELLRYQASQLMKGDQGQISSQLEPRKLKELLGNLELFFTSVKSLRDIRVYRLSLQSYLKIEPAILSAIKSTKLSQAINGGNDEGLNGTLAAKLGLGDEFNSIIDNLGNIEISLTFVTPVLKSLQQQLDLYANSSNLFCSLELCQSSLDQFARAAHTLAFLHTQKVNTVESKEFALIRQLTAIFPKKSIDLRSYLFASQAELPELNGDNYIVPEIFLIQNLNELKTDPAFATVFDFVRELRKYGSMQNKFLPKSNTLVLEFGLDEASRIALSQRLSKETFALEKRVAEVSGLSKASRSEEINRILEQGQSESLKNSRQAKAIEAIQVANQIAIIQQNLDRMETDRAKFLVDFAQINQTVLGQDQTYYKLDSELPKILISPDQAPSLESLHVTSTSPITTLTAIPPFVLKPGETLSIHISGKWSPTCALAKSKFAAAIKDQLLSVGPEGFQETSVNGTSTIEAITRSNSSVISSGFSSSTSVSGGVSLPVLNFGNVGVSQTQTNSSARQTSRSITNSTSEENVISNTAQFQRGLGLADTPFNDLPAGSLLIFRVPAHSVDRSDPNNPRALFNEDFKSVKGIRVASENFTITASADERYYLLINDCKNSETLANTSGYLELSATKYKMIDSVKEAKKVIKALQDADAEIESEAALSIKEGGSILAKLASLRSRSLAKISASDLANLPSDRSQILLNYYHSFVDYIYSKVLRQYELYESTTRLTILSEELKGYDATISSLDRSQRLREFEAINAANNYEISALYGQASTLMWILQSQVIPMLRLYYPAKYEQLTKNITTEFIFDGNELERQGVEQGELAMWKKIIKLAEKVQSIVDSNETQAFVRERKVIAVTFPRPGLSDIPFDLQKIPTASLNDSKKIWDMVFKGDGKQKLELSPELVYEASGARKYNKFSLSCNTTSVVTNHMGLFLYTESGAIDTSHLNETFNLNSRLGSDMLLPTRNGPVSIRLFDENWGNTALNATLVDVQGFNGISRTLLEEERSGISAGRGLSPFTGISIVDGLDFSNFQQDSQGYPEAIAALTLAFIVETDKASADSVNNWISACAK